MLVDFPSRISEIPQSYDHLHAARFGPSRAWICYILHVTMHPVQLYITNDCVNVNQIYLRHEME